MSKVVVTQEIPQNAIDLLEKAGHRVIILSKDGPPTHETLIDAVADADGIISILTDIINESVLSKASKLKIVANYAVGFDNIDIEAAKDRSIVVTNTPGVSTEAVAEFTLGLIIALSKNMLAGDRFIREGKFHHWMPMGFLGEQLWGKTVGIVGLGSIGSYLAEMCYLGLKMNVLYTDIKRNERFEMEIKAAYHELDTLLKQADVVCICAPLLPSTYHMISKKELSLMKGTAYLVNTARGPIVDNNALIEALESKRIAGAAMDVFEFEPKVDDRLTKMENVIITPHIASATTQARAEMAETAAKNVIAVLSGKPPLTPVNHD